MRRRSLLLLVLFLGFTAFAYTVRSILPNPIVSPNESGMLSTYSTSGPIDVTTPFFQSIGTNGRSCGSCHQPADGWSVTPEHLRARFEADGGLDPIFRTLALLLLDRLPCRDFVLMGNEQYSRNRDSNRTTASPGWGMSS